MNTDDRRTVLLVGLGNIGMRHLQGLAPLADRLQVFGADLDPDAAARAESEWRAVPGSSGRFSTSFHEASRPDLAIVASSAAGREALTMALLDHGARRLLLEKVVFDQPGAFDRVGAALERTRSFAKVNCARRLWPVHQALAADVAAAGDPVRIRARGRALGLACNGVHFIDLLQMLTGETDVRFVEADLSSPWESKRPGFWECWGRAVFATPRGARLELVAGPDEPGAVELDFQLGSRRLRVEEAAGLVHEAGLPARNFQRAPYQSELTAITAQNLLESGDSPLPDLSVSAKAHKALFDALAPTFAAAGLIREGGLPIT